MFVLLVIKH